MVAISAGDSLLAEQSLDPGDYSTEFPLSVGDHDIHATSDLHIWDAEVALQAGNVSTMVLPCSPLKYASMIGAYTLSDVGSVSLPILWSTSQGVSTYLESAVLTIAENSVVELAAEFRDSSAAGTTTYDTTFVGTYVQEGSFVTVTWETLGTMSSALTNNGFQFYWRSEFHRFTR